MAGVVDLLFGSKSAPTTTYISAPQMPNIAPTPVSPPPARTDSETQAAAAEQRRRYGISGGATRTNLTGGLGVPSGTQSYAAASLLGGTS